MSTDFEDNIAGIPEICGTCLEEAGKLIGMVTGRKFAQEKADKEQAQVELAETMEELADKTATVRVLTKELERATQKVEVTA